jgi:hypothetical protein
MIPSRTEIVEELRRMFFGSRPIADAVLAPLVFVAANQAAGLAAGAALAVASGIAVTLVRLFRRSSVRFALAGLAGTAAAASFAVWSGSAEAFFVPGIISGALTALVALISIMARRPMVAWTSMLVRRWPFAWYRHPQVLPAYQEVTWLWVVFFAGRSALQWNLATQGDLPALAGVRVIGGWPSLVVLLIVTYVYGTTRLARLGGPSIEEFRAGRPEPWIGQRRGF